MGHGNIMRYMQAVQHHDVNNEIRNHLALLQGGQSVRAQGHYLCFLIEYMDRGTVQHLMDRDAITSRCMAAIVRQVASALAFIHRHQRIHNSLNPANILLRQSSFEKELVVKLADCGVAELSTNRKRDGNLLGYVIW